MTRKVGVPPTGVMIQSRHARLTVVAGEARARRSHLATQRVGWAMSRRRGAATSPGEFVMCMACVAELWIAAIQRVRLQSRPGRAVSPRATAVMCARWVSPRRKPVQRRPWGSRVLPLRCLRLVSTGLRAPPTSLHQYPCPPVPRLMCKPSLVAPGGIPTPRAAPPASRPDRTNQAMRYSSTGVPRPPRELSPATEVAPPLWAVHASR